jgi:GDSL-like Lipase/Acylhydrolase family
LARLAAVGAVIALTVPTAMAIGSASVPPPFTVFPSSLPSAGGLVRVQIESGYVGPCPLSTTNPGVSLANCAPPNNIFDVWIPPNTSSGTLVSTFSFSGSTGGQPPTSSAVSITQSAPAASPTYVALGDSYSSGEGNPDPRNGGWVDLTGRPDRTPTANDGCDRSWVSYPRRTASWMSTVGDLPTMRLVFLACSGDTTSDIWSGSPAASYGLRGATARHMEGVQSDDSPDLRHARLVTVTAGANDIGFSPAGVLCISTTIARPEGDDVTVGSPAASVAERNGEPAAVRGDVAQPKKRPCTARVLTPSSSSLPSRTGALEHSLVATYAHVEAEAPHAALYVMAYPYLVPPAPSLHILRSGCDSIPGAEMASLSKLEVALDTAVREATKAVGAHFVDPNASSPADFYDHTICSSKGVWFNGLMRVPAYSYHPNATGQVKLFELLRSSIMQYGLAPPATGR